MATNLPSLTLDYVKELCPALAMPDVVIQGQIDYLDGQYGECLNNSYGDANGSLLAANAICYKLLEFNQEQPLPISSETAANGASTTYDTTRIKQDSRDFVTKYDTSGCLADWVAPDIGLFTFNGGATRDEIAKSQGIFNGIIR